MTEFNSLDTRSLAGLYGSFFTRIFNIAHSHKLIRGKMNYVALTPPWLRSKVIFIHGPNQNLSIPFVQGRLPNKNNIREKGNKTVACAILSTWIAKETLGIDILKQLTMDANIRIPFNIEPNEPRFIESPVENPTTVPS